MSTDSITTEFEIPQEHRRLLEHLGVPSPTTFPAVRMQHRMTFRNERTLYKRTCSKSGKGVISIYHQDAKFPVYALDEWWGDAWDGQDFGQEFDFSRSFFEQFAELQTKVPRIALFNVNPFNSDYCQQAYNNRNCYLCTVVMECEDTMYVSHSNNVRDSFDCDYVQNVELCYECIDSDDLYACVGCDNCRNCNDLWFCSDCIGCKDCIGCWGLRNQQYHIFNQRVSKDEFEATLAELSLTSYRNFTSHSARILQKVAQRNPRTDFNINAQDSVGNHLRNTKNCFECYDSYNLEECFYSTWIFDSHHCADIYGLGNSEYLVESVGCENVNFGAYNTYVSDSGGAFYSDLCFSCQDIFGCIGLRRKKNCILNKQYSYDDYETMRARVVEHMKSTGEWGHFFPAEISPFAYNESVAQERYPFTKEAAQASGFSWRDPDPKEFQPQANELPDDSREADEEVTKLVLSCADSGRNFKITAPELKFYQQSGLPLPRLSPDARYLRRMQRRGMGGD